MTTLTLDVDYGHVEPVSVHYDDFDAMGVVHNGRYPVLLERALTTFWAERGFAFTTGGGPVGMGGGNGTGRATSPDVFQAVREFTISYLAPIRVTGTIGVHFWVEQLGETSLTYGFRFLSADGGTVHAEGRRVVVRLDPATMRPTGWTDEGRAAAAALLIGSGQTPTAGQDRKNARITAAHSSSSTPA